MYELVRVGADNLIGEVIRLEGDSATIQVCLLPWVLFHAIDPCLIDKYFLRCMRRQLVFAWGMSSSAPRRLAQLVSVT